MEINGTMIKNELLLRATAQIKLKDTMFSKGNQAQKKADYNSSHLTFKNRQTKCRGNKDQSSSYIKIYNIVLVGRERTLWVVEMCYILMAI